MVRIVDNKDVARPLKTSKHLALLFKLNYLMKFCTKRCLCPEI